MIILSSTAHRYKFQQIDGITAKIDLKWKELKLRHMIT